MRGYVRIHREIDANWVWDCEHSTGQAWVDLILLAAWKETTKKIKRSTFRIERGQVVASIRYLSSRWKWSNKRVRSFMQNLEKEGMIDISQGTQITVITICNYDTYNTEEDIEGTVGAHKGHTKGTLGAQSREQKGHTQIADTQSPQEIRGTERAQLRHTTGHEEGTERAQLRKNKEIINNIQGKDEKDIERLLQRLEKRKAVSHLQEVIDIVDYFNQFSGKSVKYSTDQSLKYILDHLKDGRPVEMIKGVIWHKVQVYREIEKEQYISLPTILRRERFEQAFEEAKERKENLKRPKSKPTEPIENREAKRLWVNGKKTDRYII